ncbi:MAG: glycosyltransferase family 39 protein [Anaerolineae bacterium]|nr:glycosyltransferase family 39 protein [Anaerolineae bacterium]
MIAGRRAYALLGALALAWGVLLALLLEQPGYTDAYYYFNAARRLAEGHGLTDPYLWTYFNAPDRLPGPSHTYWMPLQSLIAAASMAIGGATFRAAQVPAVLCYAGLVLVAFGLGERLGARRRHAWVAALLVMFSGFYIPYWVTTDTFALFGLVGALALLALGRATEGRQLRWYALGGALGGLAHLTRADGVLLVLVLAGMAFWRPGPGRWTGGLRAAGVGLLAYGIVMLPWFARNLDVLGTPLPLGGADTIWMRSYDELVRWPPGASASDFLAWGAGPILRSRLEALANNLGTFVAVETWVILGPLALLGGWRRRSLALVRGFALYAAALHFVMTFVFAFPGYRGGLFHSSAALLPFWAALAVVGLDEGIAWAAQRRRWRPAEASAVFNGAAVLLALALTLSALSAKLDGWNDNARFYREIARDLPADVVLMVNDPVALYYQAGLSGVVVPDADPAVVPEIAARYGVTHLLLDANRTAPFGGLFAGEEVRPFLRLVRHYRADTPGRDDDRLLFEIVREGAAP